MGAILILTPVIIGSWPLITAAVAGAAAAMGLAMKEAAKEAVAAGAKQNVNVEHNVEIELDDSQVLTENVATGQEIVLTKGAVEIRVRRDERGRCVVCAKGMGHNDAELRSMAEEFSQKMTQCFVYNKVMTELRAKGFQVAAEEQMEDESVRIHVRRWEG